MATRSLKRIDLLLKEVKDPHAQENFWRLRDIISDISRTNPLTGPQGPIGPTGPSGPAATTVPRVTYTFTTDVGTLVNDLVYINAANTVTKITANSVAQMPNGIFGVAYFKSSTTVVEVLFLGPITGYGGLTVGSPVFVSATGTLTHTPPTSGMVQQIGFAISATDLFVQLLQPMRRS